ncbi:MAG: hypothetical protein NTY16_11145 [Deltaproteobacteria bacterium]|nr:hypothetical protein [Deltaproteobacteria bacterium]
MAEILWSNKGVPLMAFGKSYFASTTGSPEVVKPAKTIKELTETETFEKYTISPWGSDNNFPGKALDIIGKTGVLNTGLKFIRNFTLGQGIFPVKILGYDDQGNEKLEIINDPKLTRFLEGRIIRRYMANALRDYFKLGIAFPQLILNADGTEIVGINTINAQHCRLTEAKNGVIENCIIHGAFPDLPVNKAEVTEVPKAAVVPPVKAPPVIVIVPLVRLFPVIVPEAFIEVADFEKRHASAPFFFA